uniref:Adenosine 5'-monophosphoramidase HINT3 n=1 Tax=Timema cristinae TaxID=61476 RepID=A0A7R9H3Y1_TIMCR|nr:unnamed protein product [Timema cristinae]
MTCPKHCWRTDDNYVAFSDIKPASKYHYLIIPKQHISDAKSLVPEQKTLVEDLVRIAKQILEQTGADLSDVRFGFHWPPFHSISHLHLHAIAPASQMGFISRGIFKPDSWWFVTWSEVLATNPEVPACPDFLRRVSGLSGKQWVWNGLNSA